MDSHDLAGCANPDCVECWKAYLQWCKEHGVKPIVPVEEELR